MAFNETIKIIKEDLETRHKDQYKKIINEISDNLIVAFAESNFLIYFKNKEEKSRFTIVTSKIGFGNEKGSYKTPLGLHKVCNFIGEGCNEKQIFKNRKATKLLEYYPESPNVYPVVLTRILQLEGLEDNYNQNTKERNIYIHGTPQKRYFEEKKLKKSHGCLSMLPCDIIKLFEIIDKQNDLYVYILDK